MPSSGGIAPFKRLEPNHNFDTRLLSMITPSQSLMPTSSDQFRMPLVPASVSLAASSAAQSDTRPGLSAGFGTATPLEHCAVYCCGIDICRAAAADAPALKAVAPSAPVSSSDRAITDASARAVAVLIARAGICRLMFIRLFSRAWWVLFVCLTRLCYHTEFRSCRKSRAGILRRRRKITLAQPYIIRDKPL